MFAPSVGGVEVTTGVLATDLAQHHGDSVTVVTRTPNDGSIQDADYPFQLIRRPSARQLWAATRQAEVVLHNNPCLRLAWPLLLVRRPWVVALRMWLDDPDAKDTAVSRAQRRLKRALIGRADRIVSNGMALAGHLPGVTDVVPNGYRHRVFSVSNLSPRPLTALAVVGRLVEGKGVDLAVMATAELARRGHDVRLQVIGDGPERPRLTQLAAGLGVSERVSFVGQLSAEELARLLNHVAVVALPSRRPETFGTVALEAIACGCVVVAADHGGFREAVGGAGLLVRPGDELALADGIASLLDDPEAWQVIRRQATDHLAAFSDTQMVDRFRQILTEEALGAERRL